MRNVITRILMPTDFSPPSEQAFNYARGLAQQLGASLHLLHVVNRQLLAEGLAAEASITEDVAIGLGPRRGHESAFARAVARCGIGAEVLFGFTATSIVDYASRLGVDLVS